MKLDILYNKDCMGEKGMRTLPDKSIDMVLCDPPYEITACKWDTIIPLEPLWKQLKRVIKPNGAIVLTASQPFTTVLIASNMKMFKYCWVWEKDGGSNFATVKYQPMKEHEDIVVFCSGRTTYNPIMEERIGSRKGKVTKTIDGGRSDSVYGTQRGGKRLIVPRLRNPRSIQRFNRERGLHPTQKPVALMEYLIKTYTNEDEIVLDFAFGSGTTLVACRQLGRHYIGFETNPEYCKIAKKRLAQVQLELGIR